jgi:hypothetical protein
MIISKKEEDTLVFGESPSYFSFFDAPKHDNNSQPDDAGNDLNQLQKLEENERK